MHVKPSQVSKSLISDKYWQSIEAYLTQGLHIRFLPQAAARVGAVATVRSSGVAVPAVHWQGLHLIFSQGKHIT